jgi:hypothetical protein
MTRGSFGRPAAAVVAAAVLITAVSCSSRGTALYPVSGSVVFEGRPAAGAVLTFHRVGDSDKTNLPHAVVREDGTFSLTTRVPGDGAAPGQYEITVIWRKKGKGKGDDEGSWMIPFRYLTAAESGLTAEVKNGPTELPPFVLTK